MSTLRNGPPRAGIRCAGVRTGVLLGDGRETQLERRVEGDPADVLAGHGDLSTLQQRHRREVAGDELLEPESPPQAVRAMAPAAAPLIPKMPRPNSITQILRTNWHTPEKPGTRFLQIFSAARNPNAQSFGCGGISDFAVRLTQDWGGMPRRFVIDPNVNLLAG